MKIGIDISQIAYEQTGVANYLTRLVQYLLEIDKKNEYVLFYSNPRDLPGFAFRSPTTSKAAYRIKRFRLSPTWLDILWNRLHILPLELFVGSVDVFITSDWTEPPTLRAAKVAILYDLVVYKYPEGADRTIIETHKRRLRWLRRETRAAICISESTKRDVQQILSILESNIIVIYPGIDQGTIDSSKSSISMEGNKVRSGIRGNYILFVGTLQPRKNIIRLIEAFSYLEEARKHELQLIIVGRRGWLYEGILAAPRNFGVSDDVTFLEDVNDAELSLLYSGAECLVYPSLYEGFGLPIIEAMKHNCPVITSNISSMPEAGGDAALYVDPLDASDIAKKIELVLSDKDLRSRMIVRGRQQAEKFSWEKAAQETLNVLEQVVQ